MSWLLCCCCCCCRRRSPAELNRSDLALTTLWHQSLSPYNPTRRYFRIPMPVDMITAIRICKTQDSYAEQCWYEVEHNTLPANLGPEPTKWDEVQGKGMAHEKSDEMLEQRREIGSGSGKVQDIKAGCRMQREKT